MQGDLTGLREHHELGQLVVGADDVADDVALGGDDVERRDLEPAAVAVGSALVLLAALVWRAPGLLREVRPPWLMAGAFVLVAGLLRLAQAEGLLDWLAPAVGTGTRTLDLLHLGTLGLSTRKPRAALSALGIALGIATMVVVTGIPASGQRALLDELTALGTNMLRAQPSPRQEDPVLLAEGRFAESPAIAFRWLKAPGEIYGRGPVMKALPDIRTANKVVELVLKNASIAVTGIWQAEDDGVLNPDTVKLVPGAIIPKAPGSAGLTPLAARARGGRLALHRVSQHDRAGAAGRPRGERRGRRRLRHSGRLWLRLRLRLRRTSAPQQA